MGQDTPDKPMWTPSASRIAATNLARFQATVAVAGGKTLGDYDAVYRWSIAEPAAFWRAVWDFGQIVGEPGDIVVDTPDAMPGARWFPDATLNFAENILRRRDRATAIIAHREAGAPRRLSAAELYGAVSRMAQALRAAGIGPGDRVGAYLPNVPEAIVAMLAAASIGAVWSSCSPDFGAGGVLDRFGQIAPKVLFAVDGYIYGGKRIDCRANVATACANLPSVERIVVLPFLEDTPDLSSIPGAETYDDFIAPYGEGEIDFAPLPFDHPLYILFSSGTTGPPKCIVHGAGGTLLQHIKEHQLLCDIQAGDHVFYFTTLGWMMWNWLVTVLAGEAAIVLFDGSPFEGGGAAIFDLADAAGITHLGLSAKFIDSVNKAGLHPAETHDLSTVGTILSTGSPLAPESFDFVYRHIKADVCLSSVSGGTDIVSCFVGGNPTGPVWRGEIQAPALGMAVDVFDDDGNPMASGKGELVCTRPFPSMPVAFWNDAHGARYHAAYFERFAGVWHHGDFAERTAHGGFIIHGRSDAVLNPGGVRIGTAEIYRQVERIPEIEEALAIGQDWQGDTRVVLFVRMRAGATLDDSLVERIKDRIRQHVSPRHVPARILTVSDIPRTKSGKIVELAVRDVVHGRPVKNTEALANPEALDHFRDRKELESR
ncbi:MAG: acetoacetate--CoA ligase [Alphaproteobacteria bacterium]